MGHKHCRTWYMAKKKNGQGKKMINSHGRTWNMARNTEKLAK